MKYPILCTITCQIDPNMAILFLNPPNFLSTEPSKSKSNSKSIHNMSTSQKNKINASEFSTCSTKDEKRKLPVLLFDVMDTIIRDPFYQDVPAFFGMSMKELMECKHPTAWNEFEKGLINEDELAEKFFKDGRHLDLEGLKTCMKEGYSYLKGMEELLKALKQNDYEMHAFTNYPIWYQIIEDKLKLSNYLSWTFCSCKLGKQKPDPDFYNEVIRYLEIEPKSCVFVDDRKKNVDGAAHSGMIGLHFKDAELLHQDLSVLGLNVF